MYKKMSYLIAVALIATFLFTSCDRRKGPVGSAENPLRFYFMPLKGKAAYDKYSPAFERFIEANSGLAIETTLAEDFITIIEAFGKRKADAAFMNTLGYLMAHDWAKAEAHLTYLYGDVYNKYRGEVLVRTDSGIATLKDLDGKTVAFADPFSAGGYLYPLKLFKDNDVKPKKTVFAGGHLKGVEMLYNGEVDAACTYHERPTSTGKERDARTDLMKKYPDIISKLKILSLTGEIPTGPIALSKDMPSDVKAKFTGAVLQFARTPEGRDAIYNLYNITGFTLGKDSDYDGVRSVLKELGKSIDDVVPGGITFYRRHSEAWLEY